jgi:fibro-slime domain-containing protein
MMATLPGPVSPATARLRALALGLGWLCACGGDDRSPSKPQGQASEAGKQTGAAGRSGGASVQSPGGADNPSNTPIARGGNGSSGPAPGCGNGMRTSNEACDDANTKDGDGCSADCLGIEPGYSCQPAGTPCRVIARCGDNIAAASEACDDGNTSDGDGCSAHCRVERNFQCSGDPSKCSPTTCGDGKLEGTEGCDDGNLLPFDGCSANCETEPNCSGGACTSKCGDGLVLNEDCDDGNTKDGDGCSSACKLEKGFECTTDMSCEKLGDQCILRVSAIFRDFNETHTDFGVGCGQLTPGVVDDRLNAMGKPVLANGGGACIMSAETFDQWYTNNDDNVAIVGELTLYDNGRGGFVNRWGPDGEQFPGPFLYSNIVYGGPGGTGCEMCMPSAAGQCFDPCMPWGPDNQQACCADATQEMFDGNPLFFPIDDAPNNIKDMRFRAKIPEQYGYDGWPWEDEIFPNAPRHDFHFTTEVVYWFKYDPALTAVLDFNGDDDVWVFVNGRLALDLGAPHVPEAGTVTVNAMSANRYGLMPDQVYELRVFHAERKVEGSSFKLTLSGFNPNRSDCTPICGDGIVTSGEECDDGTNDGGYEECAAGCILDARCGDGIMQEGEDCDDGNRRDGDNCGSSCRNLVLF